MTAQRSPGTHPIPALILALALAVVALPAAAQTGAQERVREYIEQTGDLIVRATELVADTESGPARQILQSAAQMHKQSRQAFHETQYGRALDISRRARDAAYHAIRLGRETKDLEERIRIRVERFQEQQDQLTERARESGNRQAEDVLDRARRKADRARDQYRQGDFQLAWKMFEQAGDLQRRAARLLAETGNGERLEREIEFTSELLDRTADRLGPAPDPEAQRLLDQAREMLDRSRRSRDQGQPLQSLRQVELARQLGFRARSTAGLGPDEEAVRSQIERFDDRLTLVSDRVREAGSDRARSFVDRAIDSRNRAEKDLLAGDTEQALRLIRTAYDLLGQAEDLIP